jgi:hypothetical protein
VHCEVVALEQVPADRQPLIGLHRTHAVPEAFKKYPGEQLVQTELPAVVHASGLVQFAMRVHAVQSVGTVLDRQ